MCRLEPMGPWSALWGVYSMTKAKKRHKIKLYPIVFLCDRASRRELWPFQYFISPC